jgi:hypothetical protein
MSSTHNEIVRESFTAQATAFAANPWVSDDNASRAWFPLRGLPARNVF